MDSFLGQAVALGKYPNYFSVFWNIIIQSVLKIVLTYMVQKNISNKIPVTT
jgi:hypothetical protein